MNTIRLALFVVVLAATGSPLAAQDCNLRLHGESRDPCNPSTTASRGQSHIRYIAANAGLGAITAGLARHWRGGSFWEGALGGAAGGGLSYTGKVIATREFAGSGIIGRQVAAVGSSIILNTSRDVAPFSRVALPFGPVHFDVLMDGPFRIRPRLDVANMVAAAIVAADPDTELSWAHSFSSGAFVFVDRQPGEWLGRHTAGVITVRDRLPAGTGSDTEVIEYAIRHERVHLLQADFTAIAWGRPAEDWILSRIPGGATVHEFALLRSDLTAWAMMNAFLDHSSRPTESEAYFLNPRLFNSNEVQ